MVGLNLISSTAGSYIFGVADINPSQLKVQGNGAHLFNLLRPDEVPEEDKVFFYEALR